MKVELHEDYIQLGGDAVGEEFVRALVELADRLFPTGWRVQNGFVIPANNNVPSRTPEWVAEMEEQKAAKEAKVSKKKVKKTSRRQNQKPTLGKRRAPKSEPKAIKLKRRKK